MSHLRQQILEGVAAQLAGLATTGANVFRSRVYAAQRNQVPCLIVRQAIGTEQSNADGVGSPPRVLQRVLRIEVIAIVREVDDLDAALNQICLEVETALGGSLLSPATTKSLVLVSTDTELTGSGEQPMGQATLTYEVLYLTFQNAPSVAQ